MLQAIRVVHLLCVSAIFHLLCCNTTCILCKSIFRSLPTTPTT